MTLGGTLKHLAYVEDSWSSRRLYGRYAARTRALAAVRTSTRSGVNSVRVASQHTAVIYLGRRALSGCRATSPTSGLGDSQTPIRSNIGDQA